jgi:hypothetical protein
LQPSLISKPKSPLVQSVLIYLRIELYGRRLWYNAVTHKSVI